LNDGVRVLLSLTPGLNGYLGVCHGGIVAAIPDEALSLLVHVCRQLQGLRPDNVTDDLQGRAVGQGQDPKYQGPKVLCRRL
ncbi:hypothetical protein A1O1_00460, partial [Capronia coronata CBS 617.96]